MTDLEVLRLVQRKVLEPASDGVTWATGLWTLAEVLTALDQRQQEFLRRTGLLGGWQELAYTAGPAPLLVPEGTLQRVWHGLVRPEGATWRPLLPGDRALGDRLVREWRTTWGDPLVFAWEETQTAEVRLLPVPSRSGRACLFGPQQPEAPQGDPDVPVLLALSDEWVPFLVYGVLATLLRKHGRGYDEPRARYCEARYAEGLEAAEILATPWAAS